MTEIAQQHAPATTPDLAPARRRWSPRVRLLTAAASIAVLVIGISVFAATTGGPTGRGPAAFAIENLPGGKVSIRVVNNTVSAAQMTRQLQDVGLSITIDAVPASPQLVGRWLTTGASEDVPGTVIDDLTQQALGKTATLDITRTFPGQITLTVGRSPRVGEDPQVSGTPNALSPGGLLYCQRLSGQIPSAAAKSLTDAGYTVSWAVGGVRRSVATAPDGTRVVQAYIFDDPALAPPGVTADPKTVQLIVLDPTDARYQQLLWTGYPLSASNSGQRDYGTCPAS